MPLGVASTTDLQALETRLAALEEQLADFRAPQPGQDSLTPSYLTIDPTTGKVGAQFSGALTASSLILPAGVNPDTSPRVIFRTPTGTDTGYLYSNDNGTYCNAGIVANHPTNPTAGAAVACYAGNARDTDNAALVQAPNAAGNLNYIRTLLDGAQRSDFVQAATTGRVAIDYGVAISHWPVAGIYSAATVVSTRLGRVPGAVFFSDIIPGGEGPCVHGALGGSFTAAGGFTVFSAQSNLGASPAGFSRGFFWLAIG